MSTVSAESAIPIPARMASLERFGNLAIPWITARDDSGKPIFSGNIELRRIQAIREQLCSQCGQKLEYWIIFIGDDESVKRRIFFEPGMHQECAEYAAQTCPYLANPAYKQPEHAKVERVSDRVMAPWGTRSLPMAEAGSWLYRTRGYKILQEGPKVEVKAQPAVSLTATTAIGK